MAGALSRANKRFDYFVFPGQRHGYGDMSDYWFLLRAEYLVKAAARRSRISDLWMSGDGHAGDRSVWEAYNGFVQWADHETGDAGPVHRGRTSRLASINTGTLANVKTKVFTGLVNFAAAA